MTSSTTWTPADLGAAMIAHALATWSKGWRRRSDGIEGPAQYRDGDNPLAFRIVEPRGVAMDARAGRSFSAKQYAAEIAGCASLVDFMQRWGTASTSSSATTPAPVLEAGYPPIDGVRDLWAACRPVDADDAAKAWLESRGLDVARIVDADCARALPVEADDLPSWARCNGVSWANAYRIVAPLVDAVGLMRSLHARRTVDDDGLPKSASPRGTTTRRLVLADAGGLSLLRGGVVRDLVIVEGMADFLTWATDADDADEDAPAIIGILSGSWTARYAARVPDGRSVIVDVDRDAAGDHYAEQIRTTFKGRKVDLCRTKAREP